MQMLRLFFRRQIKNTQSIIYNVTQTLYLFFCLLLSTRCRTQNLLIVFCLLPYCWAVLLSHTRYSLLGPTDYRLGSNTFCTLFKEFFWGGKYFSPKDNFYVHRIFYLRNTFSPIPPAPTVTRFQEFRKLMKTFFLFHSWYFLSLRCFLIEILVEWIGMHSLHI